jgi:ribosomal protein S18 acetylase RimI-like enzyme
LKGILLEEAKPRHYGSVKRLLIQARMYNRRTDSKQRFLSVLRHNKSTCFVARQDDEIIGMIFGTYDGWSGILHRLVVTSAYRGRGIGSKLVAKCVRSLRLRGACTVFCHIKSSNRPALSLFQRKLRFSPRHNLILFDKAVT